MDKPESTRQLKVAREIQRDLAEIIRSKGMAVFAGAMVTVSEVRISPDLSIAKVYVSIFPSAKAEQVMGILEENKKALQGRQPAQDCSRDRFLSRFQHRLRRAHRRAPQEIVR